MATFRQVVRDRPRIQASRYSMAVQAGLNALVHLLAYLGRHNTLHHFICALKPPSKPLLVVRENGIPSTECEKLTTNWLSFLAQPFTSFNEMQAILHLR